MQTRLNPQWVAYQQQAASVFRLHAAENGPIASAADATDYVMGVSFKVTSAGLSLGGWWWWVADAAQSTGAQDFALWASGGPSSGSFVAGSKVTSGAAFGLGWNFVPCGTPIALTSGQEYRAVTHTLGASSGKNGYSVTAHYWDTGPGIAGLISGPLLGYSAPGNANGEPSTDGQMTFLAGGTDVTTAYPHDQFNSSNYWLDVQVS